MKIAIYYFSGTGNTARVAEFYRDEFSRRGHTVTLTAIDDIMRDGTMPDLAPYDLIGIGWPVHAFNAPHIVHRFLKKLSSGGKSVFLFKTAGDHFIQGGANILVRKHLYKNGFKPFHEALFVMPANMAIAYPPALVKQLTARAAVLTRRAVAEIEAGTIRLQTSEFFRTLFSVVASISETWGAKVQGRISLFADKNCTRCGLCVKSCPVANIRDEKGIRFGWRCLLCMRCFYRCPTAAIRYGRIFHSLVVLKEGYDLKKILDDPAIPEVFVTAETKGYYKRLYRYLYD